MGEVINELSIKFIYSIPQYSKYKPFRDVTLPCDNDYLETHKLDELKITTDYKYWLSMLMELKQLKNSIFSIAR